MNFNLVNGRNLVSENGKSMEIPRLVMIAEEGIEAVKSNIVHHRNGISWDDRPDNLVLMESGEHGRLHGINRQIEKRAKLQRELGLSPDKARSVEEHREIRKDYLEA